MKRLDGSGGRMAKLIQKGKAPACAELKRANATR